MFRRPARRAARRTTRRVVRRTRRRMVRRTVFVGGMMVLAAGGAYSAVKLSKKDAQRIEEHTGIPPQELEDQDLDQAMRDLNIQSQPLTPEEQAALDQQGSPAPAPQAEAVQPVESESPEIQQSNYLADLEKLGELKDKGILTEEEFITMKKQILGL